MTTCDTDCEVVSRSLPDMANQVCAIVELLRIILPLLVDVGQVAPQGEDVPQTEPLGLLQVARDVLLGRPDAGHVQHGLDADVLDGAVGDHHAGRLRVSSRVSGGVPRYVWRKLFH